MDLTEIKQLITESIASVKDEILSEVRRADQGVASNLTKELKKLQEIAQAQAQQQSTSTAEGEGEADEGDDGKRLTVKALQGQLNQLKAKLAEQEQKALEADRARQQKEFEADRTLAISSVVSSQKLNHPATVQKLFSLEYAGKLQREGNRWFVDEDGKVTELSDLFKAYLQTEEGKYYLPPSGANGAGITESMKHVSSPKTEETPEQIMARRFLGQE